MLVLARLRDQSIVIGDDITVTVADIRGDKVRLGIDAPRSVTVHRKEIYDQIVRENRAAGGLRPEDVPRLQPPRAQDGNGKSAGPDPAAHAPFLRAAMDEAKRSLATGSIPTGAVLVRKNQIVSSGSNGVVQGGDPTAHAEIECLRRAGRQAGGYQDTVLYSTAMPCHLGAGAILQLGIPKVVVGDSTRSCEPQGPLGTLVRQNVPQLLRSAGVELIDLADAECREMMAAYLRDRG